MKKGTEVLESFSETGVLNSSNDKTLRFKCPHCSVVLKGKLSNAGKERKCPRCDRTFRIPRPRNSESAEAPQKERSLIPVICGVCSTRMYANSDQIGQSMECPDCFTQNLVKQPKQGIKPTAPSLETGMGYDLEPAQEIEITRSRGEDLLEEADREVEKNIEAEPELPAKPFIQGVWLYPLHGHIFPILLGMVLAWTLVLSMVKFGWDLQGNASAITPILLTASAFMFLLMALPTVVSFQKILVNTSNADDEADCRPDGGMFSFVDWIGECAPMAAALFCCVSPTFGILKVAELRIEYFLAIPIVTYLLFPLLLMSIMESASITGIFSIPVWKSIAQIPGTWFKFYFSTAILATVMAGAGYVILGLSVRELDGRAFAIGIAALSAGLAAILIYFRLLGRVALIMTETILVDVTEPDNPEDREQETYENDAEVNLGV